MSEIMTPASELVTLRPDEDASRALDELASQDVREVPVLSDGHLEGLVRRRDIVRWLRLQTDTSLGREIRPGRRT